MLFVASWKPGYPIFAYLYEPEKIQT